jgi:glyoxylase-like metal-dependent hydrolase (beta-lactamase superfamily II)
VYIPSRRLLFAGDAAGYLAGLRLPVGMFTEDGAAARASFRRLAQLNFDVACFGHGKPITKDASSAFRKFAGRLT